MRRCVSYCLPSCKALYVDELLTQKAVSNEKTLVARPAALVAFLAAELAAGQAVREQLPVERNAGLPEKLDNLFRQLVHEAGPLSS